MPINLKEQVKGLLSKVPMYDPKAVAQQLASNPATVGTAADIHRGEALISGAKSVAKKVPGAMKAVGRGAEAILAPANRVGPPVLRAMGSVGKAISAHPRAAGLAVGTAALAPILGGAFTSAQKAHEDDLMSMRRDPSRLVTASIRERILEKAAADAGAAFNVFKNKGMGSVGNAVFNKTHESFASGVGSGIGQGVVGLLGNALSAGVGGLRDMFVTDPLRRKVLESVMRSDTVISQALARDPDVKELVVESYGTMCRFAPSLATDVNAVRSFLREVVMGGSGVNYAVIKNLIETEKALTGGKR